MEKTTDPIALSSRDSALGAVVVRMEVKDTASVLKSMVCVGETRKGVLDGLKARIGPEFDGSLWKAVEWLEQQGVDLESVPRLPPRSEENPRGQ